MSEIHLAKQIIIVGLGTTGLSCAQYFTAVNQPFSVMDEVLSLNELTDKTQGLLVRSLFQLTDFDRVQFDDDTLLVVSPGVNLNKSFIKKAIQLGARITSDIEIFNSKINTPIIAVTGTNGKSTVVTLLTHVLSSLNYKVVLAGNIGIPVLSQLDKANDADFVVLELSSFQLDLYENLRPLVGVFLNISEDHLERYVHFTDYLNAKQKIFNHARAAVYCEDDLLTYPKKTLKKLSFGLSREADFYLAGAANQQALYYRDTELMTVESLPLKGKHNLLNALAVLACCKALTLDLKSTFKALQSFSGLPHRCQVVTEIDDVLFINDSKGTNPGACLAALHGFGDERKKRIILIAGGLSKNSDFSILSSSVERLVKQVLVFGKAAGELIASLPNNTVAVTDLQQAILKAKACATKGDIILFSPACASFDMFDNYQHRGEVFQQLVLASREGLQ